MAAMLLERSHGTKPAEPAVVAIVGREGHRRTAGIERNMREPGPYAAESVRAGEPGSFFDDYCNWERIPEFRRIVQMVQKGEREARIAKKEMVEANLRLVI